MGSWLLDRLLPATCLVCDHIVQQQGQLCGACFCRLSLIAAPFCQRCAVPFAAAAQGGRAMICDICEDTPPVWRHARAALRYDDLSKQLILQLKHGDRVEIAAMLATRMAHAGADILGSDRLLIPVPLARSRLFARRYNQSALLAQQLARHAGCAWAPGALRRIRATASLGGMNAQARKASVAGAFAIAAHWQHGLRGRDVVLIDDVLTSGATAAECSRVLIGAGVASVDVLVAARVPDPRV